MGRLVALCLVAVTVLGDAALTAASAAPPSRQRQRQPPNEQVARGARLFAEHCAHCHGRQAQGTRKGPPLVGKDALPLAPRPKARIRKVKFRTAKDVLDWTSMHMPADDPGSRSSDEYGALVAFLLQQNGVDVTHIHIDKKTAGTIRLH